MRTAAAFAALYTRRPVHMLRVCRARQCIARHAELVLSATVSYATAYHGSLGHTDGGVILSSSTAHASLRLLRTCAISALQLAVCQHMEMRGHLFCQSKCQHRQRVCLNLVKVKRVEPEKDVVAERPISRKVKAQDTVAISQPSAAPPFDPASFHATNFTRAQSAQRA